MADTPEKQDEVVVETPEENNDEPQYSPDELQAMEEGWAPKDKWKGPEDEWVPAKAFLKYGRVESELKRTRSEASQKEKTIKAMKEYYLNMKEDAKKEVLDSFRRQKREAIKNEDYQEVAKLDLQIDELSQNLDRKFKQHDEVLQNVDKSTPTPPPEFFEWNKKNSWYVLGETGGMTREADALSIAYRQMYPNSSYSDVLNYVEQTIKSRYSDKFDTRNPRKDRPSDVSEPSELNGNAPNKRQVRLKPEEKAAADAFGISYEEYAKGLQAWDKMKGVG